MEKLETWEEAWYALKAGHILCSVEKGQATYYVLFENKVRVHHDHANYFLKTEEFADLFQKETFYVYENKEEVHIDKEKDDEYYSWWHK